MKHCLPFLLAVTLSAVLLACRTEDDPAGKSRDAKPAGITVDQLDTAILSMKGKMLPILSGIIIEDVLDTARVWRFTPAGSKSVTILRPNYWLIGPTNRVAGGQMTLSAAGAATPNAAGDSWQLGGQTLNAGAGGEYIPVQLLVGKQPVTLLVSREALTRAYNEVR